MGGIIRAMSEARPAGFWIRAVAAGLDVALFVLVRFSFRAIARRMSGAGNDDAWALEALVMAFTLAFTAAYSIVLHTLTGQTIGKMLTRVRVVGDDGLFPPFGAALLRYFGYYVSLLPFGTGFVMAGLRRDRRALHDLLAGTRVERPVLVLAPRASSAPVAVPLAGSGAP
jgi:uncharacterized RDD family membrane protein YckC